MLLALHHHPTRLSLARHTWPRILILQAVLGIAISEAVEVAATNDDVKYSLGSVLNHVLMHQTIVGVEALKQMEMAGDYPDVVVGCTGGGSNFAGLMFPFLGEQLRGGPQVRVVAVEPADMSIPDTRQICLMISETPET